MRKLIISAVTVAGLAGTWLASADPRDQAVSGQAFMEMRFDGVTTRGPMFSDFAYGVMIDHDRRFVPAAVPPLARVEFNANGFDQALINGLAFASRVPVLNQAEQAIEYTFIDWGLLAAGAVGVGFVVAEVADGEDDPETSGDGGGGDGGGGDGGGGAGGVGGDLGGVGGVAGGLPMSDVNRGSHAAAMERRLWMDGGTGQMGDLDPLD